MVQFRPRGVYNKTKRESWITTQWYNTEEEAKQSGKAFGTGRYSNIKIKKR